MIINLQVSPRNLKYVLRTARNGTTLVQFQFIVFWIYYFQQFTNVYETNYSRMDQVKFEKDSLLVHS